MDMDLLAAKVSELAGFVWNGLLLYLLVGTDVRFIDTQYESSVHRREGTARPLQRMAGSLVKFYTTKYPPFPDTGCRFRRYIPFFRRDYRRGGGQNRTPFSPRPPA